MPRPTWALFLTMSIPSWPPCTHPLMATSSSIMHHVTNSNHFKLVSWTWQWVHCTKMASQSPDLNPIDHLWDLVEQELCALDVHPTNLHQLQDAILSIWANIFKEWFQHLVESMPRRIKAVLKVNGGQTQY